MSTAFTRSIHTVDSHTEGNPTRVVGGGVKVPPGATLLDKRAWLMANDDGLRRLQLGAARPARSTAARAAPAPRPGSRCSTRAARSA